jgi:hypothetical protein
VPGPTGRVAQKLPDQHVAVDASLWPVQAIRE